ENSLKTRFNEAVVTAQPHVSSPTRSSSAAGRGRQRRRQVSVGAGIAAVTAMVVGGAAYLGAHGDLLGSPAEPADSGPGVVQLAVEAATPRGLAAAVMSHIDGPELFGAAGGYITHSGEQVTSPDGTDTLMVKLGYTFGDESRYIVSGAVSTDPDNMSVDVCADASAHETCTQHTLSDGTEVGTIQETPTGGNGPEVITVVVVRSDQVIAITLLPASAPSGQLPLSPAELEAIATDPLVGVQTSAAMNQLGEDISLWGKDPFTTVTRGEAGPPTVAPANPPSDRSQQPK
ncbi:MAG: hypothetical protein ACR2LE_02185, partial [Nocardioidaceae bacterium]